MSATTYIIGSMSSYPARVRWGLEEKRDPSIRYWQKVDKTESCWIWIGQIRKRDGYGYFWDGEKKVLAHRWGYQKARGAIKNELDHLCRVRACVNPEHLEDVTHKVNVNRGAHCQKTHCPQGHEYTKSNTYIRSNNGRVCRKCRAIGERARKQRLRNV